MAGYEALLDGLGLKILDRRLRRDHAERTRMNRINETERLNAAVRKETARQEERSAQIKKDRETKKQREFEQLMAMVRTKISNLPPAEREKMERSNKSKKTKTSKEAFVISGEVLLPDNSTKWPEKNGDGWSSLAFALTCSLIRSNILSSSSLTLNTVFVPSVFIVSVTRHLSPSFKCVISSIK